MKKTEGAGIPQVLLPLRTFDLENKKEKKNLIQESEAMKRMMSEALQKKNDITVVTSKNILLILFLLTPFAQVTKFFSVL